MDVLEPALSTLTFLLLALLPSAVTRNVFNIITPPARGDASLLEQVKQTTLTS